MLRSRACTLLRRPLCHVRHSSTGQTWTAPTSILPAGSPMKGLNFVAGAQDPVALPESEYPAWLWSIATPSTDPKSLAKSAKKAKVRENNQIAGEAARAKREEDEKMKWRNKEEIRKRNREEIKNANFLSKR
ncbi:hypothetical protein SAICODRAFT_75682 [Saitoella complicata NRRL Y-17804]|uniref:Large ribosomal subunit protein mL54 n=1 Tax=Saitoella complicata (strain BCRC 22490 / CBS 7301 / JCM 7358 / NBRC 10748 / NRRL Y-17804) TaxID=698492 RepID=A0A0E9N8R4_SAICN|nr:uncharacterized protein SAICODRAFT_75682 [Saitoella complicata NRRL Y-17804]ODQ55774.1 hypothetical protein SAICODRAFT_75682 [Saitoella complicata NRRL Y-17804]GAO46193.1 hypothetical protein G7K_0430-t1 [Saitoella complicata NRRL Y-17804]